MFCGACVQPLLVCADKRTCCRGDVPSDAQFTVAARALQCARTSIQVRRIKRMKTTSVQSAFDNHCWTLFKASPKSFRAVRLALLCCLLLGAVQPVRAQQNTPPTISAIPDQVTEEDVPLIGIPFTVWDAETPPDQLRVSGTFFIP